MRKEGGKIENFVVQFVKGAQNEEFRWLSGKEGRRTRVCSD